MKTKIKKYFEKLNPEKIDLKNRIKVKSVKKIGMGSSNSNFLVLVNGKKFVFRMNMHPEDKDKIRKEFEALKIVEKTGIAPRVFVLDESRKDFDSDFLILEYLEGKTADKIKPYFNENLLKNLANLLVEIHSVKITGKLKNLEINKKNLSFKRQIKHLDSFYIDYIKKYVKNREFLEMLKETMGNLKRSYKKDMKMEKVLSQGDFSEENIVISGRKYSLIDFESLGISSRSAEIAFVFVTFGQRPFNKNERDIFLKEYVKSSKISKAKEKKLNEKIGLWRQIMQFLIFLWGFKHALRVKNRYFHSHFIKNSNLKKEINYAKKVFMNCLDIGVIDEEFKELKIDKIIK